MAPINFTADFRHPVEIKKLDNDKYIPHEVSFVELDLDNEQDIHALGDIVEN